VEQLSILDLVGKLSSAIARRPAVDPSFTMYDHLMDPRGYSPRTPDELAAWEELTRPGRHEEMVAFVEKRSRRPRNPYAEFLDSLLLKVSNERYAGNPSDSGQT
jgi:hypothetical protein